MRIFCKEELDTRISCEQQPEDDTIQVTTKIPGSSESDNQKMRISYKQQLVAVQGGFGFLEEIVF